MINFKTLIIIIFCYGDLNSEENASYTPIDVDEPKTFMVDIDASEMVQSFYPGEKLLKLINEWCVGHGYSEKYKHTNFTVDKKIWYFINDETQVEKSPFVIEFKLDHGHLTIQNRGMAFNGKYSGHSDKLSKDVSDFIRESLQKNKP